MFRNLKSALAALALMLLPVSLYAQNDVCLPASPWVPDQSKLELARIESAERAEREAQRRNWDVKMFPAKYVFEDYKTLWPLCIFHIEVIPQPTLKVVQIRAPKELLPAIEDALKRVDTAQVSAKKNIELTAYVLLVGPGDAAGQALPTILQPVANQIKPLLPSGNLYLADSLIVRGIDGQRVTLNGDINFSSVVTIREATPPIIHLEGLNVNTRNAQFNTSIDVPVGSQVVVGRVSAHTIPGQNSSQVVVLVVSARILE